ncbi:hypothetical protein BH24BAC1_BH24BAC1_24920 [soil metagenome]
MNQQFNLRRFGLLLKLDLAENKKTYLLTATLIVGLLLLLMLPMAVATKFSQYHFVLHILAMPVCLLAGSAFSSTLFNVYGSPPRGIAALMVPASKLEKFLAPFLVHLVYALGIILVFWAFHFWFVQVANNRLARLGIDAGTSVLQLHRAVPFEIARSFSYLYFFVLAANFTGSIYFPKNAFVKTAALCMAAVLGVFLLNAQLAWLLTGHDMSPLPFGEWRFLDEVSERIHEVNFPEPVQGLIWVGLVAVVAGLWYLAYVRLKEKEI